MRLNVHKLNKTATLPTRGSKYAAGVDLYSSEECIIPAHTRRVVGTGISVELDAKHVGYYLRVAPRSGLSVKHCIDIGAGVIDYDYRGEIKVCMINNGDTDYSVNIGDRIAQMILEQITLIDVIESVKPLTETERGDNGFGSTGV